MIEQTIRLSIDDPIVQSDPALEWLIEKVGPKAPFPDCVDLDRPWHPNYCNGYINLSFARATDATMFLLRWS